MSCVTIPKSSYVDLGCFNHCGFIEFPFVAKETGIYFLVYHIKGIRHLVKATAIKGERFKFNAEDINECFEGCVYILNELGERVITPIFDIKKDFGGFKIGETICFDSFKIKIQISFINKKEINLSDFTFALITGKKIGEIKLDELLCNTMRD